MRAARFARTVGGVAVVAPALHLLSDVMEWRQQGFNDVQLWINLIAFLPMPFLLAGLIAWQGNRKGRIGWLGAGLYGAAFIYFLYTTILAISARIPTYEQLWAELGWHYTLAGSAMVLGGLLFAWSAWRANRFPRMAVALFLAGILTNLAIALLPVPDILQVLGSALRNIGLMVMGVAILFDQPPASGVQEEHE
ncbi:hypothetical protein [Arenimonas sp.]|uniref:hypothetical protein n=1 Tax=Arenimonas sp. TaxID=1872635 RepID=UPI0039E58006